MKIGLTTPFFVDKEEFCQYFNLPIPPGDVFVCLNSDSVNNAENNYIRYYQGIDRITENPLSTRFIPFITGDHPCNISVHFDVDPARFALILEMKRRV